MTDGKLGDLRRMGIKELADSGIDSAPLDWDLLAMDVLKVPRSWLHCHLEQILSEGQRAELGLAVSRRAKREPLHYIMGKCPFWSMDFAVSDACLVPRPETEILVEGALENFKGGLALDWGTGSGCIAGALLLENQDARCIAVDSSPGALEIAYINMKRLGFLDRCLLWHCCDLSFIPVEMESLDLIVSNPPYVRTGDLRGLMPEVSLYEPKGALDGGKDGLDPYRALLPWASRALKKSGEIWVEFGGDSQAEALKSIAPKCLELADIRRDLSGNPCVMAWSRV